VQSKVVTASLLLVVCIVLIACGPSASETNALGTAVATSIFATQTAGAPALAATPPVHSAEPRAAGKATIQDVQDARAPRASALREKPGADPGYYAEM